MFKSLIIYVVLGVFLFVLKPMATQAETACQIVEKKNFVRECQCMLDTLLECAPLSLRASKEMIHKGLSAPSMEEAFKLNYPEHITMLSSYDTREGSKAFLEKRTPLWRER